MQTWSVGQLREDARQAGRTGDQEAAIRLLERALEDVVPGASRLDILLELAAAEARTRTDDAIRHYRQALPLIDDQDLRFGTAIRLARCLAAAGRVTEALDEVDTVRSDATTREQQLRAEIVYVSLSRQSLDTRPLGRDRLATLAQALRSPIDDIERAIYGEVAYEHALMGAPVDQVRHEAITALGGEALSGLHDLPPLTRQVVLLSLCWCGELRTAERAAQLLIARADRRGIAVDAAAAHSILCNVAWRRGALQATIDAADYVLAGAGSGFTAVLPAMSGAKAMALAAQGHLDAAQVALKLPGGDDAWSSSASYQGYLIGRARVRLTVGDDEGAYRDALRCGTLANAMGTTNPSVLPWRSLAAHAACNLRMTEAAVTLAEEELQLARQFGAPAPVAAAARALACARGDAEAVALLEDAASLLEAAPDRLERARVGVDLASRLRALGRHDEAAATGRTAAALCDEIGAAPVRADAGVLTPASIDLAPATAATAPRRLMHAAASAEAVPFPEIHALGGFAIVGRDGTNLAPGGLPGKAVRILIAAERPVHLEEMADILWEGGVPSGRLRERLRTVLTRARTPAGSIIVRNDELLMLDPRVTVDADRFEAAARAALGDHRSAHSLERTVAASLLYTGDLLPGDPYAEWATLRREHLRMKYLALCDRGAELAVESGLPDLAVDLLEAAIRHDRYDDQRIDRAADILSDAGRHAAARAMTVRADRVRRTLGL